jgi:hypothetical protein
VSAGRQSRRLPRREVLIIAGLALVTFVITLSVLAARTGADVRGRAAAALKEQQKSLQAPPITQAELSLEPDDFMLAPATSSPAQGYIPWRPRTDRWTQEMINQYWVDPRQVAADIVSAVNDQAMETLFQKVP